MKINVTIFLAVLLSSLSMQAKDYGILDARARDVSLVQLIVQPEKYSGISVRVRGVLHWHLEGSYLFLTREHFDVYDTSSAIGVGKSKKEGAPTQEQLKACSDASVIVEGMVRKEEPGDGYYIELTRVLAPDKRRSEEKQKESIQSSQPAPGS